jgi:carbon storage regulator
MLVLTRRANQSIVIGNDVVVTVLEVRGDQVRLGIKAPREVTVHREEVYAEIQRENREAAVRSDVSIDLPLPAPPSSGGGLRGLGPKGAKPIPPPPRPQL